MKKKPMNEVFYKLFFGWIISAMIGVEIWAAFVLFGVIIGIIITMAVTTIFALLLYFCDTD